MTADRDLVAASTQPVGGPPASVSVPALVPLPAWGRASMAIAGLAGFAMALYQVSTPGPSEFRLETAGDWFRELSMLVLFAATIPAVRAARGAGLAPRVPAILIPLGYGLIVIGVLAGLVLRDDPDWFFLLGGPGILLAAIGFVWWAIDAWRRRTFPSWACLLIGVGGFFAILLAEFGSPVLLGSFWLWLAWTGGRTQPEPA